MATVNVRRLDDELVQSLKRRAAGNNRSLESEVRHILVAAAEDDVAAKRMSFPALAAGLRRRTKDRIQTPSETLIREDRGGRASDRLMRMVVDASVALKWLVEEEGSEAANRLLQGDHELYAPRLMASEIANALWRKARLGEIGRGEAGCWLPLFKRCPFAGAQIRG